MRDDCAAMTALAASGHDCGGNELVTRTTKRHGGILSGSGFGVRGSGLGKIFPTDSKVRIRHRAEADPEPR